jgi:hypothetical protein
MPARAQLAPALMLAMLAAGACSDNVELATSGSSLPAPATSRESVPETSMSIPRGVATTTSISSVDTTLPPVFDSVLIEECAREGADPASAYSALSDIERHLAAGNADALEQYVTEAVIVRHLGAATSIVAGESGPDWVEAVFSAQVKASLTALRPDDLMCSSGAVSFDNGTLWLRPESAAWNYRVYAANLDSPRPQMTGAQRAALHPLFNGLRAWAQDNSSDDLFFQIAVSSPRADLDMYETWVDTGSVLIPDGERCWLSGNSSNDDLVFAVMDGECSFEFDDFESFGVGVGSRAWNADLASEWDTLSRGLVDDVMGVAIEIGPSPDDADVIDTVESRFPGLRFTEQPTGLSDVGMTIEGAVARVFAAGPTGLCFVAQVDLREPENVLRATLDVCESMSGLASRTGWNGWLPYGTGAR